MWQWDDVRFLLAAYREGTLSGAARALAVDRTTVGRRLAALEQRLGAKLVNRTPDGLMLTSAGRGVLNACENMEGAAAALERLVAGHDSRLSGTVRIATTEALASCLVVPALCTLHDQHPGLEIELLVDYRALDIARSEADLAIRLPKPTQPSLVCRKLGQYGFALYASPDYMAKRGRPIRGQGFTQHSLIGYSQPVAGLAAPYMGESLEGATAKFNSNGTFAQARAGSAGLGIAQLPCCVADRDPALERVWPDEPPDVCPLWLVSHEDLRRGVRIRIVSNAIVNFFRLHSAMFRNGADRRHTRAGGHSS
ncbi:MAG: LysR family transcriptional regulator [Candidatus Binataceae bacterium]